MRILSGIQPTGALHIGNYFGAIKQWLDLQQNNECIFIIVDLHAMTVPYNPQTFQKDILEKAVEYIALGLDPEKCIVFVQSKIKEHTELAWILNILTPVGELERMTQFKEKAKKFKKNINAGLLTYPILQAADILLYQTDAVPVGEDQKQHIELTRTIAKKFNNRFGQTFKEPKTMLPKFGARIMSLANPSRKMSKTEPQGALNLFDKPEIIQEKIMTAVTDSGKEIKYDSKKKPAISNLLTIFSLLSNKTIKELEKEFKNKGYAEFKKALANSAIKYFQPYQRKKIDLQSREGYIEKILDEGTKKARVLAQETMQEAKKKVGLT